MSDSQHNDYGDPTPATTGYVALIGTIVFILILLYLAAVYYNAAEQQRIDKVVDQPAVEYERTLAQQNEVLADYHYFHDYANETGRVTIPLEEARSKLLEEWDGDPNSPEGVGSGTGTSSDADAGASDSTTGENANDSESQDSLQANNTDGTGEQTD